MASLFAIGMSFFGMYSIQDMITCVRQSSPGRHGVHLHPNDVERFKQSLQLEIKILDEEKLENVILLTFRYLSEAEKDEEGVAHVMKVIKGLEGKPGRYGSGYPIPFGRLVKAELDKLPQWKVEVIYEHGLMWIATTYKFPTKM